MAHELMDTAEFYDNRRESNSDLDDTLEAAWDDGQALADEIQVSKDFVAGEIDRRGSSDDEVWSAQWDSKVMKKEAAAARHAAAAGNPPDRPPTPITAKAADEKAYEAHLAREWDKRSGAPAKPAETRPEAAPPQQAGGLSPQDRAALDRAPPETRALIEREYTANQRAMAPVNALSDKWGGALAQRGATTAVDQVQHIDRLLETEHRLMHGSPETKIRAMQEIARVYGVGAPSGGPAPQAHPQQAQMQPPPPPPSTGNALQDQLQRSVHEQRLAEWGAAMQQAAPEAAMQQRVHHAASHIMEIASATNQDGSPAHPYFGAVGREMYAIVANQMQNGQRPDLVGAYHQAVASRPDIFQDKVAKAKVKIRKTAEEHPVIHDPTIRKRLTSVVAGHVRTGRPVDLKAALAEALRREPIIGAKYENQMKAAKARGGRIEPTLDQMLESIWQAQAA